MRVVALALLGCKDKDGDGGNTDTGPTSALPPPAAFLTSAVANDMDGVVDDATVTNQALANTWTGTLQVLLSDAEVQNRLGIHTGAGLRSAPTFCWDRPSPALSEFTINYDFCASSTGLSGGIRVEDHPAGPLLFHFLDFTLGERSMGGVLGMDFVTFNQWYLYETDSFSPGPDNRVPITFTIDGLQNATSLDGGMVMEGPLAAAFHTWAVAEVITIDSVTHELVLGGTSTALDPFVQPPEGTDHDSTCDWESCRCTTSGTNTFFGALALTEVRVDLDDLQDGDDGFDDPELEFPASQTVDGTYVVTTTGCGKYDATFTANETVIFTVNGVALESEIQQQCELLVIEDPRHCDALVATARASTGISLALDADKLSKAGQRAVRDSFDDVWCNP